MVVLDVVDHFMLRIGIPARFFLPVVFAILEFYAIFNGGPLLKVFLGGHNLLLTVLRLKGHSHDSRESISTKAGRGEGWGQWDLTVSLKCQRHILLKSNFVP